MNKIALHEVGHLLALFAVGLGNEFLSSSIGNQTVNQGVPALGSTNKTGYLLSEYSQELGQIASHDLENFVRDKSLEVCLRYIVFYLGGYAIDKKYGNSLPKGTYQEDYKWTDSCLTSILVDAKSMTPAMMNQLKSIVYDFLYEFFENNKCLIDKLVNELSVRRILYKVDVEEIFKLCVLANATEESWNKLKDAFFVWYDDKSIIKNFGA